MAEQKAKNRATSVHSPRPLPPRATPDEAPVAPLAPEGEAAVEAAPA
jgi:hypothetical protein